jgi:nucleoside-diphosphate-sugar epimerase
VVLNPTTVYGISKMAGEKWCEYYFDKYGVDVRSIRYPGLISWKTPAGGGTTDYAVEIFTKLLKKENIQVSFLRIQECRCCIWMMPSMQPEINGSSKENLTVRSSYNLGGMSFTPKELAEEIKKEIPDFRSIITRISDRQLQIHGRLLLMIL